SRQLLGARKTPWNHSIEYGPVVVSLVTPSAHLPASGLVSALHRLVKSSAFLGGVAPIWSNRFCWTYIGQPVMERGIGTPYTDPSSIAMRHWAGLMLARLA